jgi:hypothetical protein
VTWSRLDDLYDDHPKVLAAMHMNPLAVALHVTAITASSRRESDGLVDPFWLLARVPDRKRRVEVLRVLVELALFEVLAPDRAYVFTDTAGFSVTLGPFPDERYVVHGYLDFNPSSAQLQDRRRRDSERKAGGRRKESAESPNGVHADTDRNPSGPSRGSARALPQPIPVPSQSQEPPLAPPAIAGGELDQSSGASPVRLNSRALGTSPRQMDAAALAGQDAAAALAAVGSLTDPGDAHRKRWEKLRVGLRAALPEDASVWGLYVEGLELAAVDGDVLVIDGPDRSWAWHQSARLVALTAERTGVRARLATREEHEGLRDRAKAAA